MNNFYHVIDNFFEEEIALKLSEEFPDFNSDVWHYYNNPLENKKTLNHWDKFPKTTYDIFSQLCSPSFIDWIESKTGLEGLYVDIGLHGGGYHIHSRGGKLNLHKDYSIHPKLKLRRKLNLIVYLEKDWNPEWGGALEIWSDDPVSKKPKEKVTEIDCVFNRAVLLDTTEPYWHGLPTPLNCPEDRYRKSIAVYYLDDPTSETDPRERALFAPSQDQIDDPNIMDFIDKRSRV